MKPPSKTYELVKEVKIDLTQAEQEVLRRFVNIAHTGSAEVNHYVDGRLVARFADKDGVLTEAHRSLARTRSIYVALEYDQDGQLVGVRGRLTR